VTWVVLATVIPLAFAIGPALRTGTVSRRLHGELSGVLGPGWSSRIAHIPATAPWANPPSWVASIAGSARIRVRAGAKAVSFELEPIGCRGELSRLSLTGAGTTGAETIVLRRGFHWYRVGLSPQRDKRLTLTVGCVAQPGSRRPPGPARPTRMAIAGVLWLGIRPA
jgi:hypothetical protein